LGGSVRETSGLFEGGCHEKRKWNAAGGENWVVHPGIPNLSSSRAKKRSCGQVENGGSCSYTRVSGGGDPGRKEQPARTTVPVFI